MKQQGVALITAVLIVALVTAVAVAMASRQQFDIRRTANIFNSDKAYLFALGAEDYARNVLEWDITTKKGDDKKIDHMEEDWARVVSVPVEGAMLTGSLQDLQGRFNVNSLIKADGKKNDLMFERFKRLLKVLELEEGIAEAVLDWLDDNPDPTGLDGAEDDYYMLQDPPYRSAHGNMASGSELLLVKGVDYESYLVLEPFVTALPVNETAINVNTAPAEILASLSKNLTVEQGEQLVDTRDEDAFADIEAFNEEPLLKDDKDYDAAQLSVGSEYFLLNAMAEFDQSTSKLNSLLERDKDGKVKVIMRSRGVY